MAQKHQLFLKFPESTNEGLLQINDISIYNSLIPVNCTTLEITPPGYSTPTVLTGLPQNFNLILNACGIGLLAIGCDEICPVLPDGIYHFRFSVSPNNKVYVEYNMLRITSTLNQWYKTLCWINDTPCTPQNDTLVLIRELQLIESQIITAKHLVEDIHDYDSGMEMLKYAKKKLDDTSQGCHYCR